MRMLPAFRPLACALAALAVLAVARPAQAFCVRNVSSVPVRVTLQSINALAGFSKVVQPGRRVCCDWMYRKCNPAVTRNARVTLRIAGYGARNHDRYCSGGVRRRTMATSDGEVTVFDDPTRLGGLRCDSRDFMRHDAEVANPALRGTPYLTAPRNSPPRRPRPAQEEEAPAEPEKPMFPDLDRLLPATRLGGPEPGDDAGGANAPDGFGTGGFLPETPRRDGAGRR